MLDFKSGTVRPGECLTGGWELIKDQLWLFVGMTLVALLIMQVVPIILMGPMMCGLHLCFLAKMRGEKIEFGYLFKGFDYFVPSLIASLIQVAPIVVLSLLYTIPLMIFIFSTLPQGGRHGAPPDFAAFNVIGLGVIWGGGLVLAVVAMAISALFTFTFPLIVEHKLAPVDAIKTSVKAAWGNFGGLLLLLLLSAVVGMVGMLLCFVGYFLALPVIFAAQAVAYRQVFPASYAPQQWASPADR